MVLQIYKFYFSIFYIYKTLTILHVYKFFSTFSSFLHIFYSIFYISKDPKILHFYNFFSSFFYISTAKKDKSTIYKTPTPPPLKGEGAPKHWGAFNYVSEGIYEYLIISFIREGLTKIQLKSGPLIVLFF